MGTQTSVSLKVPGLKKRVGAVTVGRSANALALLAINVLLARLLSKADYGTYQQASLLVAILTQVLIFGLPMSLLYFYNQRTEAERPGLVYRTILLLFVLGVVVSAVVFFLAAQFGRLFHNPALPGLLRIFALYALGGLVASYYDSLLVARRREGFLALYLAGFALASFVAVMAVALTGLGLARILGILVAVSLLRAAFCVVHTLRTVPLRDVLPSREFLRAQFAYSIPLGLTGAAGIISRSVDKVIISHFFSPERFAVYANGALEIPVAMIFLAALATVLVAEFSRLFSHQDRKGALELWRRSTLRAGLLLFPLFAVLAVGARDLMVVLFSDRYLESAIPFLIYLLVLPSRTMLVSSVLLAFGATRTILYGTLLDLGLNIALSLALVKTMGFYGPAVGTVVASYASLLYYASAVRRRFGVTVGELLPWKDLSVLFGKSLLPALAAAPLLLLPIPPLARLALVSAIIGVVSFFLARR